MKLLMCLNAATGLSAQQVAPIPPAFSASIQYHPMTFSQDVRGSSHFTHGQIKKDFNAQTEMWELHYSMSWVSRAFDDVLFQQVVIQGQDAKNTDRNGVVCMQGVTVYLNTLLSLWAQLPEAGTFDGTSSVFGVECDIWSVRNKSVGNFSTCIDHNNIPRSVVAEPAGDAVGWSNVGAFSHNITFHDIATGDDADMGGIDDLSCWLDNMTSPEISPEDWMCHANTTRNLEVLRAFNSPEPMGVLENRDTFDWPGTGVTLQEFDGNEYLELFEVEFDRRFGYWRDCNYNRNLKENVCDDAMPTLEKLVTRSSAEQLQGESLKGMCEPNSLVGSWYTFPLEGKCAENASVGDDGCTWKMVSSKVINMSCMKRHNFFGWLISQLLDGFGGRAPFPRITAHVQSAMQSCPDVREAMTVVV